MCSINVEMCLSNSLLIYLFLISTKSNADTILSLSRHNQLRSTGTSKHQLSHLDSVLRLRVSNIITKANASLDWRVESRVPGLDKVNVASVIRN